MLDEHTFVALEASVPDTKGRRYPERLPEVPLALESAMAARSFTWPLEMGSSHLTPSQQQLRLLT